MNDLQVRWWPYSKPMAPLSRCLTVQAVFEAQHHCTVNKLQRVTTRASVNQQGKVALDPICSFEGGLCAD